MLLSGGIDSATTLAVARHEGFECHAITFEYGQRHRRELRSAAAVARALGAADHRVVAFDLRAVGGSALTGDAEVPKGRRLEAIGAGIPVTYVPARNTIFLSVSLGLAEAIGSDDLFIGANAIDYSGYPDCRPEFLAAFEAMARLATKRGVEGAPIRVHAPLISLTKAQIIARGIELGVDFSLTFSCYDPGPGGRPCARCDACLLRAKGIEQAGLEDPAATSDERR